MCKIWIRPCSACRKQMTLSGLRGHREPCTTYRRRQAESRDTLTACEQEIAEQWRGTGGRRKCDDCQAVTRERTRARRKMACEARKAALRGKKDTPTPPPTSIPVPTPTPLPTPTPTLDERCEWGDTEDTKVENWSFLGKVEYESTMSLEEISGVLMN